MESPGQRLTRPAERARPDPVAARPDDELGHGLVMKRRLGKGATALALLVERDGREHVLKVALSAERFAAAVTLHQMAAGSLPRWGDGRSEPAVLDCEATIDADAFEPAIREGMTEFFRKALRRDYRVRFDNAEEMLRAWRQLFLAAARPETDTRYRGPSATPRLTSGVFLAAARPETDTDDAGTPPRFIGIAEACPDTLLGVLGLSARGMNATERMGVRTVGDLLRFPLIQVNRLRGVGSRTRRELSDLARRLAERFPEAARAPKIATTGDSAEIPDEAARASVDELRRQLLPAGRTAQSRRDTDLLAALLGLGDDGPAAAWPSQSDVARALGVSPVAVSHAVARARLRWLKIGALTRLRHDVVEMLEAHGNVMTRQELAGALLARRGSVQEEPLRSRYAGACVPRSRWSASAPRRGGSCAALRDRPACCWRGTRSMTAESRASTVRMLADYAECLGHTADELSDVDPLPAPARAIEVLQAVTVPAGVTRPAASRLPGLAAAASRRAALSSRLEIYPRGMAAQRALRLALGALAGARTLMPAGSGSASRGATRTRRGCPSGPISTRYCYTRAANCAGIRRRPTGRAPSARRSAVS